MVDDLSGASSGVIGDCGLIQMVNVVLLLVASLCPIVLVLEDFGQDALGVLVVVAQIHASTVDCVELVFDVA